MRFYAKKIISKLKVKSIRNKKPQYLHICIPGAGDQSSNMLTGTATLGTGQLVVVTASAAAGACRLSASTAAGAGRLSGTAFSAAYTSCMLNKSR